MAITGVTKAVGKVEVRQSRHRTIRAKITAATRQKHTNSSDASGEITT